MENMASLTIFCPEKMIRESQLMVKAHENREIALSKVVSESDFWSINDWGFTKSDEFHDPVYLTLKCNAAETLQVRYIEDQGTLTKVQLPIPVTDLLSKLRREQSKGVLGRFSVFILENHIYVDCEADGTITFRFDMCEHEINYKFSNDQLDLGAEPSISLKS